MLFGIQGKRLTIIAVSFTGGDCSCDQNYIGETVRNAEIRWNEHEDKNSKSEPVKQLKENPTHKFRRTIINRPLRTFVSTEY